MVTNKNVAAEYDVYIKVGNISLRRGLGKTGSDKKLQR